jgi:DNA-binding NtrC family response regulator
VLDLSGTLVEVAKRAAARVEEEAVALALREAGGDRAAAAQRLGVSLSTLNRRLRQDEPET